MNCIEKLYYNMEKLNDKWADAQEVKEASDNLENALGEELYIKHEDVICDCLSVNHKEGFIKGFQYAVSLLTNASSKTNSLDELMANEYDAMTFMETPMSGLVDAALEIVRTKITDKEYLEIENNMIGSYNHAERFGFEQGFMRGIAATKGGAV